MASSAETQAAACARPLAARPHGAAAETANIVTHITTTLSTTAVAMVRQRRVLCGGRKTVGTRMESHIRGLVRTCSASSISTMHGPTAVHSSSCFHFIAAVAAKFDAEYPRHRQIVWGFTPADERR